MVGMLLISAWAVNAPHVQIGAFDKPQLAQTVKTIPVAPIQTRPPARNRPGQVGTCALARPRGFPDACPPKVEVTAAPAGGPAAGAPSLRHTSAVASTAGGNVHVSRSAGRTAGIDDQPARAPRSPTGTSRGVPAAQHRIGQPPRRPADLIIIGAKVKKGARGGMDRGHW